MSSVLGEAIDKYVSFYFETNPVQATFYGVPGFDGELAHFDEETLKRIAIEQQRLILEFERLRFVKDTKHIQEQLDIELALSHLEQRQLLLQGMRIPYRDASIYPKEILFGVYWLLIRRNSKNSELYKILISRLRQAKRVMSEGRKNLSKGQDIPRIWLETALAVCDSASTFLFGNVTENLFRSKLKLNSSEYKSEFDHLRRVATEEISKFKYFLENEILPKTTDNFAIGQYNYEQYIRNLHFLPFTADEIEKTGIEYLEIAENELKQISRQINPKATVEEIAGIIEAEHLNENELINEYTQQCQAGRYFVLEHELVNIPEDDEISVVETPVIARATIPFVSYQQPPAFGDSKAGYLWITTPEKGIIGKQLFDALRMHQRAGVPVVCAHEAYPGHHLQFLKTNKVKRAMRKLFKTSVFTEGWALYCEELMFREGFYKDLKSRFFQLSMLKMRAYRVLIDVRLALG